MDYGTKGNMFALLFAAVGLVGVIAVSGMQLISGPITTATNATNKNMIQTQLLTNARLVVLNAAMLPGGGDIDGDGVVEPIEYVPNGTGGCVIALAGGGCLPTSLGAALTDPYGTPYGYCVWDHGTVDGGHADGSPAAPHRLMGGTDPADPVIALISAGPDKVFQTMCHAFDGAGTDGPVKPAGSDDHLFTYTYAEATVASGGLWNLKAGDPDTAEIAKDLAVKDAGGNVTVSVDRTTGIGDFFGITTDLITAKTGGSIQLDGKVGIGIAAPLSPLHVRGQIRGEDDSLDNGQMLFLVGSNGTFGVDVSSGGGHVNLVAGATKSSSGNYEYSTDTRRPSRILMNDGYIAFMIGASAPTAGELVEWDNSTLTFRTSGVTVGGAAGATPLATLDVRGYAKLQLSESVPVACNGAYRGSIALTSAARLCICTPTGWKEANSATACVW